LPSGRRKLLLADDSPTIQKVISLTFGDEGVEVVAVGDGGRALRVLSEEPPPDVVLADVVMPGPDGYELCERIKRDERLKKIPVVLLVGTFEPFNEAEARRVGADTVLTKPFQSIRDLVSKVGSLLGGGGDAKEAEAARVPLEAPRAGPQAPRAEADAPAAESFDEAREPHVSHAEASFADLGADDELIEARPAEAFGAPAAGFPTQRESAPVYAEAREPDFHAAAPHATNGNASHAPAEPYAPVWDAAEFAGGHAGEANNTEAVLTNQADESVMSEENYPQTSLDNSFDARATATAAADGALLDLGQLDTPATRQASEGDDFVLDLDFDDEPAAPASGLSSDSPLDAWQTDAPAPADAPSAFAEAAHGEQPRAFAEVAQSFDAHASATAEPAPFVEVMPSFEPRSDFAPAGASHPTPAEEDSRWHDVVMQDGPQGFAFGGEEPQAMVEPQGVARPEDGVGAPRGFVEPEVVPADEPVPATVEGEFTDGSVEGDLPKSPSAQATPAEQSSFMSAAPHEPAAVDYAVGEARAGLEESPRAGQLSPEMIETIARRVVELMSDKVVREIAWEVVPELAELLIKQRLEEEKPR
jgi:CheY-like chemotaxis protein